MDWFHCTRNHPAPPRRVSPMLNAPLFCHPSSFQTSQLTSQNRHPGACSSHLLTAEWPRNCPHPCSIHWFWLPQWSCQMAAGVKTPQLFSVGSSDWLGGDKVNGSSFDWCEMLSKTTLENGYFMALFKEIVGNLEAKITFTYVRYLIKQLCTTVLRNGQWLGH